MLGTLLVTLDILHVQKILGGEKGGGSLKWYRAAGTRGLIHDLIITSLFTLL